MVTRSFIDPNVLIYAEAGDAPDKQRASLALHYQYFAVLFGYALNFLFAFLLHMISPFQFLL